MNKEHICNKNGKMFFCKNGDTCEKGCKGCEDNYPKVVDNDLIIIIEEHKWAMLELKKESRLRSRLQSMQMPIFTAGFFIGIVVQYILENLI